MAIPLVTERWSERFFQRGEAAQRTFDITGVTDLGAAINAVQTQMSVREATFFPLDSRLIVPAGGMTGKNNNGPLIWQVTANYASLGATITDNPLDEPAKIAIEFGCSTEPIDKDIFGNVIANSARVPFQGVYDEVLNMLIKIRRWESTYDAARTLAFCAPRPKLNSDTVTIARVGTFAPGQLKCRAITCGRDLNAQQIQDPFVPICYELEARAFHKTTGTLSTTPPAGGITGFAKRLPDVGRSALWDDSGTPRLGPIVRNVEGSGASEVSEDWPLNGTGGPLQISSQDWVFINKFPGSTPSSQPLPSTIITETITGVGTFLYYLTSESVSFGGLNLPT